MAGIAIMPIITSTAPTTPAAAAKMPPMAMVASAMPPGSRPSHRLITLNSRSATPERSSSAPIRMNIGIAERMKLVEAE